MFEIARTFAFEAAHFQPGAPVGHPNSRMHGHSFVAEIVLAGEPDGQGMIRDFDTLDTALNDTRAILDHGVLNEIEGLDKPTLEAIAVWIFRRLKPAYPELAAVTVRRPSLGHAATYRSA